MIFCNVSGDVVVFYKLVVIAFLSFYAWCPLTPFISVSHIPSVLSLSPSHTHITRILNHAYTYTDTEAVRERDAHLNSKCRTCVSLVVSVCARITIAIEWLLHSIMFTICFSASSDCFDRQKGVGMWALLVWGFLWWINSMRVWERKRRK